MREIGEVMHCPDCSEANPERARFCLACGRSLVAPEAASATTLGDERRLVTVLFADVVGSTRLAARLDPEDWKAVINGAFARLTPPIYRYGGTIPQFLGDGFLALFGAPVAHEDDAQRAVRAALELIDAAGAYRDEVRDRIGSDLAVRVGINSGPSVFGAVGTDLQHERLAVGETVNVASKLQARAEPMTALISDTTRKLLPDGFELEDRGPFDVHGIGPVRGFVPRRAPAGSDAGTRSLSIGGPMVGRAAELERVANATADARAGIGRVVLVFGEPGMGKSRLLREWEAIATEGGTRWAQANMPAYAASVAYRFAGEAVRALMALASSADSADLDSALERAPTVGRIDGARRHLADLLSIRLPDVEGAMTQPLSPQGLQARYIELVRALVVDVASEPTVLVLNDAHWSDPSSISLIAPLLSLHAELPLVVCVTARPDPDSPGRAVAQSARDVARDRLMEISLEALPAAATGELVANLLDGAPPPDGLVGFVESRAEGNPLFVEELVRMLVDSTLLARSRGSWHFDRAGSDRIPDTLQALLAARIDRLDPQARTALRIASVIGRQFPVPVLERMLGWAS